MAQQEIDVGSIAGDGTGDPLRSAFTKINQNFTELYSGNVQVTASNIRVYSVAGRTGNVVLTVNDVAQAASKSYVDSSISANIANVTGSITDSLRANITAANLVISNHAARITTLESNAASQATAIVTLNNTKATVAYVDSSIDLALSSNSILANVASVNANVSAANAAILTKANLTGAVFSGNVAADYVSANNSIRAFSYFIGGSQAAQGLGQTWANPAALFFGDSTLAPNKYYQLNLQNVDPFGSGDIVVTADDGNDNSNYVAFGIAGSQCFDPTYPSTQSHDGYVYITGGNITIQSNTNSVELMAGNLTTAQIKLTTANVLQLTSNLVIQFPDGTIQSTAFGGNTNITSINANIAAANVNISSLQSNAISQSLDIDSLWANAAAQAGLVNNLQTNAAVQSLSIDLLNANLTAANSTLISQAVSISALQANITAANLVISSLQSNAATQALELSNLTTNAAAQGSTLDILVANAATQAASLSTLTANATSQSNSIDLLNANLTAANLNISNLTSNAATQALSISTLTANAAIQALDIDNIYANLNGYLANVQISFDLFSVTNLAIANIDANLGTATNNINTLFANASAQANLITIINSNVNAANSNIDSKAAISGQVFSGNITAPYIHANVDLVSNSSLRVGQTSTINYPGVAGTFIGNVDGYYQLVVQNLSSNSGASGDIVITADDGDDTTNYFNIGINSSNWSGNFIGSFGDTGLEESPHDGYATVIGGNLAIRSDLSTFIVANTAAVVLNQDSNFTLIRSNLQFYDGTVQTSAIADVPALYANIGLAYNNIQVLDANLGVASTQLSNIGNLSYTPANVANWNGTITNIQQALDELAERIKNLGG